MRKAAGNKKIKNKRKPATKYSLNNNAKYAHHVLLRLLIHYGIIYYSFIFIFFSRNRTRYTVHLKYMYAAGVTEGGMGGVLGTFTYWKWEPSSSFSLMYVCVYKYCILYVCVL